VTVELATVTGAELAPPRELSSERATRIVEAMRASVAARGFNASTFDLIAREAGVSRGLLHYYFGTKERLLVEAVRRECEVRHEQVAGAVAGASSADEVMAALVQTFEDFLGDGPSPAVMYFEVVTLAQRNADIAAQLAELGRRTRAVLAGALNEQAQAGVLELKADAETAATFLFALADGITIRLMSEPDLDIGPVMGQAIAAARALLG
jgi:AcrR family transcriptional regulator